MLKSNIKRILAVLVVVILLTPYTSNIAMAVEALKHTDETAVLMTSDMREGGEEETGTLPTEPTNLKEDYDGTSYQYKVKDLTTFKIIQAVNASEEPSFNDSIYCLNAEKSFPSLEKITYTNKGDLFDLTDEDVAAFAQSIGTENYNALVWIVKNAYLRHQNPEYKDIFLAAAFDEKIKQDAIDGVVPPTTVDLIKSLLTDDDIDVVQQWAMWHFTNKDRTVSGTTTTDFYKSYGTVALSGLDPVTGPFENQSYLDRTGSDIRYTYSQILYSYLVTNATLGTKITADVTYPKIAVQSKDIKTEIDGSNYKIGPFKVTSGTADASSYTIKVTDGTNEIATDKYSILIEGETEYTTKKANEILDKNYYIYLPINTTIKRVQLELKYNKYETKASYWTPSDNKYQPVTLITRENTPVEETVYKDIEPAKADLALKKYIIAVNDTEIKRSNNEKSNTPVVDARNLASGGDDAEYFAQKSPIEVEKGDRITFEIRVYNEGQVEGTATSIVDYLPEGLTLTKNSETNTKYKWTESANGRVVTTDYLKNAKIPAYNSETNTITSAAVKIECTITGDLDSGKVLTNVAEIFADNINDKDSEPKSIKQEDINTETYSGDKNNKTDLSDKNYDYKGLEDDDDFEKLIIKGGVFDLNLKKFIAKINGSAPKTSREPVVDVSPLKEGATNAKYTTTKSTLEVKKGDIVIYTLRVYNEGTKAGYAEQVADYLPEGLGFLVNHNTNIDNYWSIPQDSKTIKLSTIEGATDNLKLEDFTGVDKLEDVDVVTGDNIKLLSTKLKSSTTDTKNLIAPFDRENGTKLDSRDIQIACVVLADEVKNNNFKNIAEITKETNEDREEEKDVDSTPDTVNPKDYPGDDKNQDDNDYENLVPKKEPGPEPEPKTFDLALQKFITALNSTEIKDRTPIISRGSDGKITYTHLSTPLSVGNNDVITYTIRVYNEGEIDGYAAEVGDDIPNGLEFIVDNETNKNYGWKMYDKNGVETKDVKQAASVKTTYLSKESGEARKENTLIKALGTGTDAMPDYKDVKIAFRVIEKDLEKGTDRVIINTAEITDDRDADNNPVDDVDSEPANNKKGEDDLDQEKVKVKYFDLSLKKNIVKIIITEDGQTREISAKNGKDLLKVEVNRKKVNSTVIKFVYEIVVTNEGEIEGYAKEIKDYVPNGLKFVEADNKNWTQTGDKVIVTDELADKLLKPDESAKVQVTLTWENSESNLGTKTNVAEISKDENPYGSEDIDSTPNNRVDGEDDIDSVPVLLSISTGTEKAYIVLPTAIIVIMATGVTLIKKYVL